MKKNISVLLIFLLCGFLSYAQDTFVKKYTSYVTKADGVLGEWDKIDLTVVFNEKNTDNVVLYYPDRKKTLFKIGIVNKKKNSNGEEYQIIECIDDVGDKVLLLLFDDALRIIVDNGFIEFHE